jgi:hypothetical protein
MLNHEIIMAYVSNPISINDRGDIIPMLWCCMADNIMTLDAQMCVLIAVTAVAIREPKCQVGDVANAVLYLLVINFKNWIQFTLCCKGWT